MPDDRAAAEQYKAVLQAKIQKTISEFADGKLNQEQFQAIYERYSRQISIADQALSTGNLDALSMAQDNTTTYDVRDAYEGKAQGMAIYHHRTRKMLEMLGDFAVPVGKITPTLNEFSMRMEIRKPSSPRIEQVKDEQWLLYVPGKYTTVVTLFRREPSEFQRSQIERLHSDFESANAHTLQAPDVDVDKLAYPFVAFIQKEIGGPK